MVLEPHLRKPRVLTPIRSLRVRNEVEVVPLACEDAGTMKNRAISWKIYVVLLPTMDKYRNQMCWHIYSEVPIFGEM